MNEKQNLQVYTSLGPTRTRSGLVRHLALAVLVFWAVSHFALQTPGLKKQPHCHHDGSVRYEGESISWKACGDVNGRELECSEVSVPMDQFSPIHAPDKNFTIPLFRMRGHNATQNLLLNPGGPGSSGIEFLFRRGGQLRTILGEGFHLLSFDPRGVGGSKPLAVCYPDAEARRALSAGKHHKPLEESRQAYAFSQNLVRACQDTMDERGAYINTPQTAADMNSILDAVGQEDMVYWGFSYGTIIGQTYAALFPERSKRVIIDGVANMFEWYTKPFHPESSTDSENVLHGFFDECIKAGKNCSLSTHASTKEELRNKTMSLLDRLESEPLSVYTNNTSYGVITRDTILSNAIFPALYKPTMWYELADRLAKMLEGNPTEAFFAYAPGKPWEDILNTEANLMITMNDGITGKTHFPQDRESMLDLVLPYRNLSIFGGVEGNCFTKQQWSIPHTHNFVPRMGMETAHPLLILSTTYDPVCPLISARSANAAFKDSQIIEVKTYGHASLAMPSNCVAKHVRTFLYDGELPSGYTTCEADGPIFIPPQMDGQSVALRNFDDPEEQEIHLAQLEIARDQNWPVW
ncbi:Alpha/Beta hydrolase protein [Xylariales sp. PMI_506]|nr:Alpha/Beta hydrolase protein [Xylariales sp. PMI_506]